MVISNQFLSIHNYKDVLVFIGAYILCAEQVVQEMHIRDRQYDIYQESQQVHAKYRKFMYYVI